MKGKENVYLVCMREGNVLDVVSGKSFKEVYQDTIGSNHGEFLVELGKSDVNKIVKLSRKKGSNQEGIS
ncbi:hypothetical protein HY605_02085 [Candidatus Peregrinibacteria bacterium]|nr:hypothetical protein [Candidatus Peregrinibacteria bacterium]